MPELHGEPEIQPEPETVPEEEDLQTPDLDEDLEGKIFNIYQDFPCFEHLIHAS